MENCNCTNLRIELYNSRTHYCTSVYCLANGVFIFAVIQFSLHSWQWQHSIDGGGVDCYNNVLNRNSFTCHLCMNFNRFILSAIPLSRFFCSCFDCILSASLSIKEYNVYNVIKFNVCIVRCALLLNLIVSNRTNHST